MDRFDFLALVGTGLLAGGLVPVYWPLALIVPGVLLVAIGLLGARRQERAE